MKPFRSRILPCILLAASLAATPAAMAGAPVPVWETVTLSDSDRGDEINSRESIDIINRDGVLYITVEHPVKVEIYSILGQLITSRTLKPGTVRLTIQQRGVYILKAGSLTRRINL